MNRQFIQEKRKKTIHQVVPCKKDVIKSCKHFFTDEINKNCKSKFRSTYSVAVTNLLYPYSSIYMGKGIKLTNISQIFTNINDNLSSNTSKFDRINEKKPEFFCINDMVKVHREQATKQLIHFLESKFPTKAPWEK